MEPEAGAGRVAGPEWIRLGGRSSAAGSQSAPRGTVETWARGDMQRLGGGGVVGEERKVGVPMSPDTMNLFSQFLKERYPN